MANVYTLVQMARTLCHVPSGWPKKANKRQRSTSSGARARRPVKPRWLAGKQGAIQVESFQKEGISAAYAAQLIESLASCYGFEAKAKGGVLEIKPVPKGKVEGVLSTWNVGKAKAAEK